MSWLRRRGPSIPHSVLERAFRKRKVLVQLEGCKTGRISKKTLLQAGARLIMPNSYIVDEQQSTDGRQESSGVNVQRQAKVAVCGQILRSRILHRDEDCFIIDKPAGMPVQGGSGSLISLDEAMRSALRFGAASDPRLVHRLDRETSGALVVARHSDSAAWLSAAFARKSQGSTDEGSRDGHRPEGAAWSAPFVSRMYWAVVEAHWQLPQEGIISEPLEVKRKNGRREMQQAVTSYRTLGQHRNFAWLQLTPQTGRKHQLRLHCARVLGCPIVGDTRYGITRSEVQRELSASVTSANAADTDDASNSSASAPTSGDTSRPVTGTTHRSRLKNLQLHARSLTIGRPSDTSSREAPVGQMGAGKAAAAPQSVVHVLVPPPQHMADLLIHMGWKYDALCR